MYANAQTLQRFGSYLANIAAAKKQASTCEPDINSAASPVTIHLHVS
jgi:hypothetical protein